jgi:tripartite-type tricarboxylate transporter receptor subunit TctC
MKSIAAAVAMAVAAVSGAAVPAQAEYPEKPVTMVVPYRAGGSTETMARVLAKALSGEVGQNVIVKTLPGAGGAVGATAVSKAAPDGYTILFIASSSVLWPPLTQNVDYTSGSFDYVAQISEYQQALVAKADAPFNTLEELVEYSKSNTLNFADQSAMSRTYTNFIASKEGVAWTGIPTKGGGEMVPFLLGGKVDFAYSGGIHNRYGDDMKVLVSMNQDRLASAPDAPAVSEGYGVAMPSQAMVVAPAGTPAEVIGKLEAALSLAVQDAEFADLMENKLQFPVVFRPSAEITASVAETETALKVVIEATK